MARGCPNKNSKEYKLLHDAVGESGAYAIWRANQFELPTEEEIPVWLDRYQEQDSAVNRLNQSSALEDILNNLDNPNVEKLPNQAGYKNTKTGEVVNKRVSDLKHAYAVQHNTDYKGEDNDWFGKKGTVLHKYMEEIGKAVADGRDPTLTEIQEEVFKLRDLDDFKGDKEQFFRITPKQYKLLKSGIKDLIDSIKEIQKVKVDPKGEVKFRFETSVLDEARSVAGTIDMVAVFSDGTAGVYDFKSYSRPGKQPPGQIIIDKWNVQMANYKNILRDYYGISKFRQSRAIPIQVTYSKNDQGEYINEVNRGFKSIALQNKNNTEAFQHLQPIPLEELTGEKHLDKLIEKLIREKKQTQELYNRAKPAEKQRLLNKLSRINNALTNIQVNRDISGMLDDVDRIYRRYNKRLYLDKTDEDYLTDEELVDALGETDVYSTLVQDYEKQLDHLSKKKRAKVKDRLAKSSANIQSLQRQILDVMETRVGDQVTAPGEHVGYFARNFSGIQNWNIPVFNKLNELVRLAEENKRRETKEEFEHIRKVDEAFSEWASNNGLGQTEKFDLIYEEDKGRLVRKYNEEYWDKRFEIMEKVRNKDKISQSERDWLKKHFEFDKERYDKLRDLQIQSIEHDLENGYITESQANTRKEQFYKFNSVDADPSNFYRTRFLKPKESTSQDFLSDKWKYIQQHEPVKNYYDMYIEYNEDMTEEFGHELIGKHFVANVKRGVLDQVFQQGLSGASNFFESLSKQHQIHEQDEIAGVRDSNGNPLAKVPLLYTDPIRNPIKENEKERIREATENDVEVTHERGTKEFEAEVERRIARREYEKGLETKSKDLTKSLMAMVYTASNHRHKSAIEGQVKILQSLIANKRVEQKEITEQDQTAIRKFMGDTLKKMGLDPELEEAFKKFTDMLVYDRTLQSDKIIFGKYSLNKIAKSFMNFLSVRALGLNHTIQFADYVQGRTSLWMMAKEGRYFSTEDYKNTVRQFASRDEQFKNVVDFFEPESRDLRAEDIELSGANVLSRRATQRTLFIGYAWSDENVNNTILTAMAKNYRVDSDGKIKNPKIKELIDEDAPTVFESVEKNAQGKLVIKGLSVEEFAKFRDKVQKQANLIRGSLNERQRGLINTHILGQSLIQFRSWIPGLAEARFGKLKYDQTMEDFEQGRFRVAFGEIIGNGFLPALKETSRLITETVSMGLYKKNINEEAARRELAKFLERNQQYKGKIDLDQFIKMKRDKLNGFIAELRVYAGFFLLAQLVGGLDWDKEEEGNILTWQAQDIIRRMLLEASFWWSPKSVDQIIKSPIALWGVVQEAEKMLSNSVVETSYALKGKRDPRDKTPFGYYMLKNTPVINQVLDITNFFEKYNPPKSTFEKVFTEEED